MADYRTAMRDDADVRDELEFNRRFPKESLISDVQASPAEQLGTTESLIRSVTGTPNTSKASPAEQLGTTNEMIRSVTGPRIGYDRTPRASAAEPAGEDKKPNKFMEWLGKDSTRVGLEGFFGSLGATFTGLAGIPLGGSDMSSMERAGIRAAQEPGKARQRLQVRKFREYIDREMKKNPTTQRRDMLMAAKLDPARAAQYLATESASSKLAREREMAKYRADLQLRNKKWERGEGRPLTPVQQDDRMAAASWFRSLPTEIREGLKTRDPRALRRMFFDLSAMKFMPLLYSPEGGPLWRGPDDFNIDLSGTRTVNDGKGGQKEIGQGEFMEELYDEYFGELDGDARRWWENVFSMNRDKQLADDNAAVGAVAGSIGLP